MNAQMLLDSLADAPEAEMGSWIADHQGLLAAAFETDWMGAGKEAVESLGLDGELDAGLKLAHKLEYIARWVGDPLALALVHMAQAKILQINEWYAESLSYAERAAALYELHGTQFDVAVARMVEVTVLGATERFNEALELAEWIRPYLEEADFQLGLARLAFAVGHVYAITWRLESAAPAYQEAHKLFEALGLDGDAAWTIYKMALLAEQRDMLEEAGHCYQEAYASFMRVGDAGMVVKTQFHLAQLYARQAHYGQALHYLNEARAHLRDRPDRVDVGYVDLYEAQVRQTLGATAEADRLLQRALHYFEGRKRHLEAAEVLVALSQQPARSAADIATNLQYLEQAADHLRHVDVPLFEGWVQLERAEKMLALGRKEEARQLANRLHDLFASRQLPIRQGQALAIQGDCTQHAAPRTARYCYQQALDLIGNSAPLLAARCWHGLGEVAVIVRDFVVAEAAYERAIVLCDGARRRLRSQRQRATFKAEKARLNKALLATLHEQRGQEKKLLRWVERSKAAVLSEWLIHRPLDPTLDENLQKLLTERDRLAVQLNERLNRVTVGLPPVSMPQRGAALVAHNRYQRGQISELRRRLQRVEEQLLRWRHPAQTWRDGEALGAAQILKRLDEGMGLVAFYEAGEQLAVLVARPDQVVAKLLGVTLDDVAQLWAAAREAVQRPEDDPVAQTRLAELYAVLLRPIERVLADCKRLLILPHQLLNQVPFGALYDDSAGQYAIERWVMQMAPSATVWSWCEQWGADGESGRVLVVGEGGKEMGRWGDLWPDVAVLSGDGVTAEQVLAEMVGVAVLHVEGGQWLRAADLYVRYGVLNGGLVVLSNLEMENAVPEVVSGFLYAGARTVVSGLWRVDEEVAERLMGVFYERLQGGMGAAEALRAAQVGMIEDGDGDGVRIWGAFVASGAG